jgi:hypothetical protein
VTLLQEVTRRVEQIPRLTVQRLGKAPHSRRTSLSATLQPGDGESLQAGKATEFFL